MFKNKLIARFESHCSKNKNGCILWHSQISKSGYGRFALGDSRYVQAHRWIWEYVNGPIPQGLYVLHSCDVKSCVNPDHLSVGTAKQNSDDMVNRDRSVKGSRHPNAKLTDSDVKKILKLLAEKKVHQDIADIFRVKKETIKGISCGRSWKHIPRSGKATWGATAKLDEKQVKKIRELLALGIKPKTLASQFGVSDSLIYQIRKNRVWLNI